MLRTINGTSPSTSLRVAELDYNYFVLFDKERKKTKLLMFISIAYAISIMFACSAVAYAQHSGHNLAILERDQWAALAAERQAKEVLREKRDHERTRLRLETAVGDLEETQRAFVRVQRERDAAEKAHSAQIDEYKAAFQQHNRELREAIERIGVLRGDRESSTNTIDQAWLRMDELMEENSELSNDLRQAQARAQLRDTELVRTVELLTSQLSDVAAERDRLREERERLIEDRGSIAASHDLLWHDRDQIAEVFLAPVLVYVQNLQRSSEQQHSVILELTSLAHSLHSSLEESRADLDAQAAGSVQAVEAMAAFTNQRALARAEAFEEERARYMESMESKLERLEDEALGAVLAVGEAAGRLEHERKLEEEGRWRSYAADAEAILGRIGDEVDGVVDGGASGSSVLYAAISRRIEEGITSLRGYIHPYDDPKEGGGVSIRHVAAEEQELMQE